MKESIGMVEKVYPNNRKSGWGMEHNEERLLKAIRIKMEEYGMPVFKDNIPAIAILQLIKDAGYRKPPASKEEEIKFNPGQCVPLTDKQFEALKRCLYNPSPTVTKELVALDFHTVLKIMDNQPELMKVYQHAKNNFAIELCDKFGTTQIQGPSEQDIIDTIKQARIYYAENAREFWNESGEEYEVAKAIRRLIEESK